jgi:hypothetical protein
VNGLLRDPTSTTAKKTRTPGRTGNTPELIARYEKGCHRVRGLTGLWVTGGVDGEPLGRGGPAAA